MNDNNEEMMLDLLYKRAVYGLNEEETQQLKEFESGTSDLRSFELTAAAIGMIGLNPDSALPAGLQARILADADEYFSSRKTPDPTPAAFGAPVRDPAPVESTTRSSFWPWLGWAVAAAACVALALNLYWTRTPTEVVENPTPMPTQIVENPTPTPGGNLVPIEQRQRLLDSSAQVIVVKWGKGYVKEIGNVTGDVVWSDAQQAGYVRLNGLPVNDPNKETYQLWIFEESQDPKTPIDGGTFNISSVGEATIPIYAHLKVVNPKKFAVTIEKPGGVVVSKQEKVAAIAKRDT